jgi:hypothetical protein
MNKKWKQTNSFNSAVEVIKKLQEAGYIAVLAGGCVHTYNENQKIYYRINIGLSE